MIKNINEFNKLTIDEQVNFINRELNKNKKLSVTKLCKHFGINKSTIISRFNTEGYKYNINTRSYIKNNENDIDIIQDSIKEKDIKEIEPQNEEYCDADIKELIKYKDDIIRIVKEYKGNIKANANDKMIIDTDLIENTVCNHNYKVYKNVKEEIQDLQKQYSHFKLVDIVSTALHQFYLENKKA